MGGKLHLDIWKWSEEVNQSSPKYPNHPLAQKGLNCCARSPLGDWLGWRAKPFALRQKAHTSATVRDNRNWTGSGCLNFCSYKLHLQLRFHLHLLAKAPATFVGHIPTPSDCSSYFLLLSCVVYQVFALPRHSATFVLFPKAEPSLFVCLFVRLQPTGCVSWILSACSWRLTPCCCLLAASWWLPQSALSSWLIFLNYVPQSA